MSFSMHYAISNMDKAAEISLVQNNKITDNWLSLHFGRTETFLSGSKIKLGESSELNGKLGGNLITTENNVNDIGCELGGDLSRENMD